MSYIIPFLNSYLHIMWLQSDYYYLISEKIKKLQTDIVAKVEEAEKAAANASHQQPMQNQRAPGNDPVRRYLYIAHNAS